MQTALYTGLDPARWASDKKIVHLPLIQIKPRPIPKLSSYSHILFTSRSAVQIFCAQHKPTGTIIVVGEATAEALQIFGLEASHVAPIACGEGVVELLKNLTIEKLLYPHAAKTRSLIKTYLESLEIQHQTFILYDTVTHPYQTLPKLSQFDEIIFTSPTTVEAFIELYGALPTDIELRAIGPVTQRFLRSVS